MPREAVPVAGGKRASAECTGPLAGPAGNRNAFNETLVLKREIQAVARMARQTIAAIE
jgi:hypothetical protein